jgi:hypothetical protein
MRRDTFPVLYRGREMPRQWLELLPDVPWRFIEPHEAQALRNHDQTLERLAERGGLCPSEMLAVVEDRRWVQMNERTALGILCELLRCRT